MPNSVTANRPITRNRVCTKPGTVQAAREPAFCTGHLSENARLEGRITGIMYPSAGTHKCRYVRLVSHSSDA